MSSSEPVGAGAGSPVETAAPGTPGADAANAKKPTAKELRMQKKAEEVRGDIGAKCAH